MIAATNHNLFEHKKGKTFTVIFKTAYLHSDTYCRITAIEKLQN